MAGGFRQGVAVGEIGVCNVVQTILPGFVPQIQHAAQGGVDPSAGQLIISLAVKQQIDDGFVHSDGLAGMVVDGFEIVQPLVFIINIEKLMVAQQVIVDHLGLPGECLLGNIPAHDGGDGVKDRQEGCGILLRLCLSPAAAKQQGQSQKQYEKAFHQLQALATRAWKSPILMVTEVSRSASVGLVVSSTAMPATSAGVLPVM